MKHNTDNDTAPAKRGYRRKNPMLQLLTVSKKKKTSGTSIYNITCATNESLYLIVNLEAMMSGKSVSSFIEEVLMKHYGDRISNFQSAFANLRNLEGR